MRMHMSEHIRALLAHHPALVGVRPAALNATLDDRPARNESTLAQLVADAPEIQNPLIGYSGMVQGGALV